MAYKHGITINEIPTSIITPVVVDSAIIVAVGVAPVNENLENPLEPQFAYDYTEAVQKMGMANDVMAYPLCQVTRACFEIYNIAPVIYINVLDPKTHKKAVADEKLSLIGDTAIIEQDGVMLSTLVVKDETSTTTYEPETDYTVHYGTSNYPIITATIAGAINADAKITVAYSQYDPTLVTVSDIKAGLDKLWKIYPKTQKIPAQIIVPGWSHLTEVYYGMVSKTENLNGRFKSFAIADIDTVAVDSYEKAYAWKNQNGYTSKMSDVVWPCVKVGNDVFYQSVLKAALVAMTDHDNNDLPHVSPSNKEFRISGLCLKDGTEVVLDYERANMLNGQGINTSINENGWKSWGNNTAAYPGVTDIKDRFIAVRRFFNWWGNTFILTYFQKVDLPINRRWLETIIDSENIRANGFVGSDIIASAKMAIDPSMTASDLLGGRMKLIQGLAAFPPGEDIQNSLQFDVEGLVNSILGGEQ